MYVGVNVDHRSRRMATSMPSPLSIPPLPSDRVVMVTGGAGFIGCHTVAALLRLGENVVLVDNSSAHGYPSSVKAANLQVISSLC